MRIESVTEKGACVLCMYDLAVTVACQRSSELSTTMA